MVHRGQSSTFSKRADLDSALDMVEDALEALQNKVKQQEKAIQHSRIALQKDQATDLNVKKIQDYKKRHTSGTGNHTQQRSVLISRSHSLKKKGSKKGNTNHDESSGKHRRVKDNGRGLQKSERVAQRKASALVSKGQERRQKQDTCMYEDELCCLILSQSKNRRKKLEEKKEKAQGTCSKKNSSSKNRRKSHEENKENSQGSYNTKNSSSKKNSSEVTRARTANFAKPTLSSAMHQVLFEMEPKHPKSNTMTSIPFIPSGSKSGAQHIGVMIQQAVGQLIREPPPSSHHNLQRSDSRASRSTDISLSHIQAALVNIGKATSAAALHR